MYSGFSEWTSGRAILRMPEAAAQREGSLAADGIIVEIVGDPSRNTVTRVCVSSNHDPE
eukprot:COSAG04_NODE_12271_length_661_cov_0.916370_2_plen_58_part_01